jgi:archaellum biogenesis ATPase FlaH
MFTSNYIISETYTWLRYHTASQNAFVFLETIERLQSEGRLLVIYAGQELEEKARQLLRRYRDLILCVSFKQQFFGMA